MDKHDLRASLKESRQKLSTNDVEQKSQKIVEQLKHLANWPDIKTLHCYLPLKDQKEVNTTEFFEFIWAEQANITCYTNRLVDGKWQDAKLQPGFLFNPAPELPKLDLIIVPMLGFDEHLHRLGYGNGYYDKFLATQPSAQKIGLCFDLGKVERLSIEPHDIALDMVITEENVYLST